MNIIVLCMVLGGISLVAWFEWDQWMERRENRRWWARREAFDKEMWDGVNRGEIDKAEWIEFRNKLP